MSELQAAVAPLATEWREQRAERLTRRHLDPADFRALADAGFLAACAPVVAGGGFEDVVRSVRPLAGALRDLGGADPAVALVAAMHPAVLAYWAATAEGDASEWAEQRRAVFASAVSGSQWGTITSEPGSGGDISRTRTVATPDPAVDVGLPGHGYRLVGQKHFGSGSGIADFMVTTAVAEGEDSPSLFVLDTSDRSWDGSGGMRLLAEWDGTGMKATQSHAMDLEGAPAVRAAYPGPLSDLTQNSGAYISCLFTAVILGLVDEAVATARPTIAAKAQDLRAYEQVEWTRAETEHWLMVQAFEGGVRATETGDPTVAIHGALRAKQAGAELAEDVVRRLGRVLGGGTYSQRSPFAHWFEDVRALGFLRPPWGLAYDGLFATSLS
ncbi:acyl-CoA dehydrogenase family protein [Rhabdothermincola salaria]|uniref:acyl-CoA dehydrogenase family protein n=1 Tax=Rhabdothermincola salaria TaxID=2903142 RepID=UPI001E4FB8CB|nr:acyl-CoA dehydrogenase family protein [Rhabdothermincola salaria]MCD9623111.1 acyl-CoA/acyl-ACP dehydrogenase [Rhabdothermincola salaria]